MLLNPYRFGAPTPLLLDTYPGAVSAFSLNRRLLATYASNCVRVVRSSDATSGDIAFVGDEIDLAALATFVGANTGTVESIYNQISGGTLNNGTNANRPTLVAAGVNNTMGTNGKLAAVFDSTDFLSTGFDGPNWGSTTGLDADAAYSVFAVFKKTLNTAGNVYGWGNTSVALAATGYYDDGSVAGIEFAGGHQYQATIAANNTPYILSVHKAAGVISTNTHVYRNGVSVATGTPSGSSPNVNGAFPLVLGRWANLAVSLQGSIQEIIIFAGDQSANRVAIETDLNTYYGIF